MSEDCHDSNWEIRPNEDPEIYHYLNRHWRPVDPQWSLTDSRRWNEGEMLRYMVNLGIVVPQEPSGPGEDVQVRDNFLLHEMGIAAIELDALGRIVV